MKIMNNNKEGKSVNLELIKIVREKTGVSLMECKLALEEAKGDIEEALAILKKRGIAIAQKKAARVTKEGIIGSYIHTGSKLGVLVEVNCETDYVARTKEFQELVSEIAMQIAASDPKYIDASAIPEEVLKNIKENFIKEIQKEDNSTEDLNKLLEDKLRLYYSEVCLYDQPFIKDPTITIRELIQSAIAKFGENINVARFIRYKLGEP